MADMDSKLDRVEKMVEEIHERLFLGNGRPPLVTLIDRHDQQLSTLRWALGVCFVAVIGVVLDAWMR